MSKITIQDITGKKRKVNKETYNSLKVDQNSAIERGATHMAVKFTGPEEYHVDQVTITTYDNPEDADKKAMELVLNDRYLFRADQIL